MSLFKRLFSSDYRSAVAAEASGFFDMAAEHYARAGETEKACHLLLAHADLSRDSNLQIDTLLRGVAIAPPQTEIARMLAARLGGLLLAKATREGVATASDRTKVREAAEFLRTGGGPLEERARPWKP